MADLKTKLAEINDEISGLNQDAQTKWAAWEKARDEFAAAGADANNVESDEFKAVEQVHKEYSDLKDAIQAKEKVRDGLFSMLSSQKPNGTDPAPSQKVQDAVREGKSLIQTMADRIVESDGYKALLDGRVLETTSAKIGNVLLGKGLDAAETKALITGLSDTSAGAFITNQRVGYVPQPRRMSVVRNLITVGDTNSDAVEYARQTTFTPNAAETAEATSVSDGAKPEATIAYEKVTAAVKTVANWVPATRRALSDVGQLRTLIESQLRYAIEYRLESQIIAGDGTGENFTGILSTSGILTQAKSTDSIADAVHKAITKIRLGFIEPNGIVLHPNDWELVRLSRDDSGAAAGTGGYLYGPPALAGTETMWGLPVAVTAAIADDTGLVGDFSQAVLWVREGVQILASDSHSDYFVKNLVAVLAEMRAAFGVLMPKAFASVTGLD